MTQKVMWIWGAIFVGFCLIKPGTVAAQQPRLVSEFSGKNLTTNSDWSNPVAANDQDIVRYRLVITNSQDGTTARAVNVRVMLPVLTGTLVLSPSSYVTAANTTAKDTYAVTEVNQKNFGLEYIPGSGLLTRGGSTQDLSPDTDLANLTISSVGIGDITGGISNAATVQFDARVVLKPSEATAVTRVNSTPSSATSSATSSAVAKTSPKTGITDPVWMKTMMWFAVGAAGVGLRMWSKKLLRKAEAWTGR